MADLDRLGSGRGAWRHQPGLPDRVGDFFFRILPPLMFAISGLGATVSISLVDWKLCMLIYAVGAVSLASNADRAENADSARPRFKKSARKRWESDGAEGSNLEIRLMHLQSFILSRFGAQLARYLDENKRLAAVQSLSGGIGALAGFSNQAGVMILGIVLCLNGRMAVQDILYTAQLSGLIYAMLATIGAAYQALQRDMVGVDRMAEILEMADESDADRGLHDIEIQEGRYRCAHRQPGGVVRVRRRQNRVSGSDLQNPGAYPGRGPGGERRRQDHADASAHAPVPLYTGGSIRVCGRELRDCTAGPSAACSPTSPRKTSSFRGRFAKIFCLAGTKACARRGAF
jgi:ABC-type multidrug transport system fused ATPase/permease subunit